MEKPIKSIQRALKNANDHNGSFAEEFSQLNQDMQTILSHIKNSGTELTKDVAQDVWGRVEGLANRISDINHRVSSSAGEFISTQYAKTKEKTEEYTEELEKSIKSNPLSSIAISFGLGLLIAKVIGSWNSSR